MRSTLLVPLGLGLALISAVPAVLAQAAAEQPAPGEHPRGQRGFEAIDTNQDGYITLDEWKAAGRREERFGEIDTDHDGKITREELRGFMEKMRALRQQNGDAGAGGGQHEGH